MMRYELLVVVLISVVLTLPAGLGKVGEAEASDVIASKAEDVVVAPNAIIMPLGRIILVKNNGGHGAIKFLAFSHEEKDGAKAAEYESYYQADAKKGFDLGKMEMKRGKLSFPRSYGIGRFAFTFGRNIDIECGPIKLQWSGKGSVYFYGSKQDQKDYGIKLAPTGWTDVSEVNIIDPRIKWYSYEGKRPRLTLSIDSLWEK